MGIIIYLIGYILAYICLKQTRDKKYLLSWTDIFITIIGSFLSWIMVILYLIHQLCSWLNTIKSKPPKWM